MSGYTTEANLAMDFLATMPSGSFTLNARDLSSLLLASGGNFFARGRLYEFVTRSLGAGVWKVTARLANP